MFFTAIIFLFKEANKQILIRENLTGHKKYNFELSFIESNADLMKLKGNKTIMFVDYKRKHSHLRLLEHLITKSNVSVLYIDTLEKACIANKLGFRNTNIIYLYDKKKYLEDLKTDLKDEITKIMKIRYKKLRVLRLKNIRTRIKTGKFSKYDEKYHFDNIELLIYFKIRFIHKTFDSFFSKNDFSVLIFSFLVSNIINSFIFLLK
jgi:hypothetical protein